MLEYNNKNESIKSFKDNLIKIGHFYIGIFLEMTTIVTLRTYEPSSLKKQFQNI